jgi:DNA-directed RNA polymerase specialized sigma24 family protein
MMNNTGRSYEMTPAWAWVLSKRPTIEQLVRKYAKGLDQSDLHQEVLVLLVEKWRDYDPELSPSGYSWIMWQVRLARIRMVRRQRDVLTDTGELTDVPDPDTMSVSVYRYLRIKELLKQATPKQAEAMLTVLEDKAGNDLAEYGMTSSSRNMRLYKFRKRIGVA